MNKTVSHIGITHNANLNFSNNGNSFLERSQSSHTHRYNSGGEFTGFWGFGCVFLKLFFGVKKF